jgi:hypothetical protein
VAPWWRVFAVDGQTGGKRRGPVCSWSVKEKWEISVGPALNPAEQQRKKGKKKYEFLSQKQ